VSVPSTSYSTPTRNSVTGGSVKVISKSVSSRLETAPLRPPFFWGVIGEIGQNSSFSTECHACSKSATSRDMIRWRGFLGQRGCGRRKGGTGGRDLGQAVYQVFALALLEDPTRESLCRQYGDQASQSSPHLQVIRLICDRECSLYPLFRHKVPGCFGFWVYGVISRVFRVQGPGFRVSRVISRVFSFQGLGFVG
jgi:hypothetical protein